MGIIFDKHRQKYHPHFLFNDCEQTWNCMPKWYQNADNIDATNHSKSSVKQITNNNDENRQKHFSDV